MCTCQSSPMLRLSGLHKTSQPCRRKRTGTQCTRPHRREVQGGGKEGEIEVTIVYQGSVKPSPSPHRYIVYNTDSHTQILFKSLT